MKTRTIQNEYLQIEFSTEALRIMGLTPAGKPNLLVDLSDMPPVQTPYGDFHFRGGHRLWHAPEAMPRTYIPDGEPKITESPEGILLESPTEPGTGIRKQIKVQLTSNKPSVKLTHTLINDGLWLVELSPWAITQFRLGGTVILPMPVGNSDPAGLLHNRQLSIWPYTQMNDLRVQWGDEFILFNADAKLPPFKIGYFNQHGWMGYWFEGVLFRKTFDVMPGVPHPDNNCNCEMYCNDRFVELESLAPLTLLTPGAAVQHVETWDILDNINALPQEIQKLLLE